MPIHLRQICLVAEKLAPVIEDLEQVLSIKTCHIDPGVARFGLENALLTVGTNFIEVVAPIEEGTAAGRYLDRRQGDGGYMVICQVGSKEEQDAYRARAAARDVRVAWEADRTTWRIMQLHPRDMRASFFEVDWDENNAFTGNWGPAGGTGWEPTISTDVVSAITGVELQGPDPMALAEHWAAISNLPVETEDDTPVVLLANATLRFLPDRDGRGPGLGGIYLAVADRDRLIRQAAARGCKVAGDTVEIGGTRFHLT